MANYIGQFPQAKFTIMAFASGNILYYIEHHFEQYTERGMRISVTLFHRELESNVLLIRRDSRECVAVTQEMIHVVKIETGSIKSIGIRDYKIIDAAIMTFHGVVVVTNIQELLFIDMNNGEIELIGTGAVSVSNMNGIVYVLSLDMRISRLDNAVNQSILVIRNRISTLPATSQYRLIGNEFMWNEDLVYRVAQHTIITTSEKLGMHITHCELVGERLYVLTEDGCVRKIDDLETVIGTGCSKLCSVRIGDDEFVVFGVDEYDGSVKVISGHNLNRLPTNVTLVSGELYVPNYRRIKRAVG